MTPLGGSLYRYAARFVRIVDGDTVVLDIDLGFRIRLQEHVRLFGVDTPEIFGRNATPDGRAAVAFTSAWFADDPQLMLQSHGLTEREKYGRVLGTIYRDGDIVSLNDALILSGHGESRP